LSVAGAIMALYIVKLPITTPVVIGILMLMGIVGKNAIMLVDFATESIHKGMDRTAAIIDAGQKRARPILMTSIAMAAGMAPSALGIGAGGEFRSPMANAVIGGILVSTLLSLLFVPALFTIVDDLGALSARFFGRLIGPADEAEPAHTPSIALRHDEPAAATKLEKKETQGELRKPDFTPAE
jgi:Cu/Ag efflux pump CusA